MDANSDNLAHLFAKMQENGFDTTAPLKWGFYFVDTDQEKLKSVYAELQDSGYILEKIHKLDAEHHWTLFVTKIDTLTVDKLHRRNLAFNDLATYHEVEIYDGWDVEKIESANLI